MHLKLVFDQIDGADMCASLQLYCVSQPHAFVTHITSDDPRVMQGGYYACLHAMHISPFSLVAFRTYAVPALYTQGGAAGTLSGAVTIQNAAGDAVPAAPAPGPSVADSGAP